MIVRSFLSALIILVVAQGALQAEEASPPKLDVAEFIRKLSQPAEPIALELVQSLQEPKRTRLRLTCFSADGTRVAAVFDDHIVCIWDVKTGVRVSPVNYRCPGVITALALSSDGKYVLMGRQAHNALLGESDAIKLANIYKGFTSAVRAAAISPDDKFAVFCEDNGTVHRFPLREGEGQSWPKDENDTEEYGLVHVTPDTHHVLVGGRREERLRMNYLDAEEGAPKTWAFESEWLPRQAVLAENLLIYRAGNYIYFRSRPDQRDGYIQQRMPSNGNWMKLSHDKRRLVLLDSFGYGEVRDMVAPGIAERFFVDHQLTCFDLAADGRTLALGTVNGTLHIKRLPATIDPPALLASRTLRQLLAAKDYEGLEAIFLHFEREMTPFAWTPNKLPYGELCALLSKPPGAPLEFAKIQEAIEVWGNDRPQAVTPKLLIVQEYIAQAWRARGGGPAVTVTPEGWKGFRAAIAKAEDLVVPLCDVDAPAPLAFSLLFTVAMAQQWDEERLKPYVDKLVSVAPHCLDAHFALAQTLMPRWGGAPEDLANYAARVADEIGGEAGDGVYARFALSQHFLYPGPRIFQDSGLSYERTRRGLEYLAQHAPDGDYAKCFGAWFAVQQTDNEGLIAFCKLLKDQDLNLIWPAELQRFGGDFVTIMRQLKAISMGGAVMP